MRHYSIDLVADVYQVDLVREWLDWRAESKFDELVDDPRSGRLINLTQTEPKKTVKPATTGPRLL